MSIDAQDRSDLETGAVRSLSAMTLGRIATQVVLIVSALAIPSLLGVEAFGRYATVMAVVLTLEVLGSGGLHLAETRFVAPLWTTDPARARTVASVLWSLRLCYAAGAGFIGWSWIALSGIGLDVAFAAGALIATRSALEATRQLFLSVGRVPAMMGYEVARALSLFAIVAAGHLVMDLSGVLFTLAVAHLLLCVIATGQLRRSLAVSLSLNHPQRAAWLRFGLLTLIGLVAWMTQAQVPIYLVGTHSGATDAAVFAIVVQIYSLGQALLIAPWSALMPLLSDLHARDKTETLRWWARTAMNWGVAGGVVITCGWAIAGDVVLRLLPDDFASAHRPATLALAAIAFLATTPATNGVLFAMGKPARASVHQVVFASITLAASWFIVVAWQPNDVGSWLAFTYLCAAGVFAALGYVGLRQLSNVELRLAEPAQLMLPLLATVWLLDLDWPAPGRIAFAVVATAIYLGGAIGAGLLPTSTPEGATSSS